MRIPTLNKKTEFVSLFRNGNCVVFDKFVVYYCVSSSPASVSSVNLFSEFPKSSEHSRIDLSKRKRHLVKNKLYCSNTDHSSCKKNFLTILNMKYIKCRFGFVVKKKIGNAVVRNRIRRRLKNAIPQVFLPLRGDFAKNSALLPAVPPVESPVGHQDIAEYQSASYTSSQENFVHMVFVARSKIVHSSYANILNDLKTLKRKIKL